MRLRSPHIYFCTPIAFQILEGNCSSNGNIHNNTDDLRCSFDLGSSLGEFRTASTSDLGPESRMSSPCTTPTSFPHGDLKEHFDISPITIPAALIPFSHVATTLQIVLFRTSTGSISRSILSGCRCRSSQAARRTSLGEALHRNLHA